MNTSAPHLTAASMKATSSAGFARAILF